MAELHIRQPAPVPTTAGAMGRALAGGLIMAVALGVGNGLGPVLADATGASGLAARLIAAGLVTVVAVLIVLRLSHPRTVGFGSPGASLRAFLTGVAVTAAAAALVLGAGTAVGLLVWQDLDLVTLVDFLVTNAVVAFLLEALPEETSAARLHVDIAAQTVRARTGGVRHHGGLPARTGHLDAGGGWHRPAGR